MAFAGAAFRLFTRPRDAVVELGNDDHSLWTAGFFAIVCAVASGGIFFAEHHNRLGTVGVAAAVAVAPWVYGVAYYLLLKLLGSVSITPAAGIRFGAGLTLLAPLTQALEVGASRIGSGTTIFVAGVLPLLAIVAYSALGASAAFETQRNPTWIFFSALAVVTFCWGSCDTVAGRDRYDENGQLIVTKIVIPPVPPAPVARAAGQWLEDGGAAPPPAKAAEPWIVRVASIPPNAFVFADGQPYGPAPVDVYVSGNKESVNLRLLLGASEKLTSATKDQFEVIVTMPSPPTLRFDGLYHAVRGKEHHWLRFSMGGLVSSVETSRDAPAKSVVKSLNASKTTGKYQFDASSVSFMLSSPKDEPVGYRGLLAGDRLKLRTKGDIKPVEYKFVKP